MLASPAAAASTSPLAEDHYTAVVVQEATGPVQVQRPVRHTITYQVSSRGDVGRDLGEFRTVVRSTLNDVRGWSLGGTVRFKPAQTGADLRIWLASPVEVAAAHPTCDELFSCRVGPDVFINITRWRDGPTGERDAPLAAYRRYVVNHEVGHWLGLDHRDCPAPGRPAPVMLQQTISLDGCDPRTWPVAGELRRVEQLVDDRL